LIRLIETAEIVREISPAFKVQNSMKVFEIQATAKATSILRATVYCQKQLS